MIVAAQRLGLSDRQCRRLIEYYRNDGPLELTSRRREKPCNNQLSEGLATHALNIIREHYVDFRPTIDRGPIQSGAGATEIARQLKIAIK